MIPRLKRHEKAVIAAVAAALVLIAGLPFASIWLREPAAARTEPLPLSFPHSKHTGHTGCPICHHNVKDNDMAGMPCIHCHKSDHPKLTRSIEGEFHDFCKGCHAEKARFLEKHGPVRECSGCHTATADGFMP
jgi:formate-dependent nitrite reductase cytochrome c552 subunit